MFPVTVLYVTKAYREAGEMLTRRCGLDDLMSFRHGDAPAGGLQQILGSDFGESAFGRCSAAADGRLLVAER